MSTKELIKSFENESKLEIIKSTIDEKVTILAKEDGIYYEWLNGNVSDNEYEEYFDNMYLKLYEEYLNGKDS